MNLEDLDNKMSSSIEHFEKELQTIRTSRANPTMLENIFIDAYGSKTPINQLGNISSPDSSMLTIQVWDSNTNFFTFNIIAKFVEIIASFKLNRS